MNRFRITFGLAVLLVALALPPWRITVKTSGGHVRFTALEWSFVFKQPTDAFASNQETAIALDVLTVQLLAAAVIAAPFLWLKKS